MPEDGSKCSYRAAVEVTMCNYSLREAAGSMMQKTMLTALLPRYGFDAYGVDGSSTAVAAAENLAQDPTKMQQFPVQNSQAGRGSAKVLEGDFFSNRWLEKTGISQLDGPFDLIYDYTFLCALPPSLRPRWAARMSELLAPDGTLICLEWVAFPTRTAFFHC